jgi:hypothetical protein
MEPELIFVNAPRNQSCAARHFRAQRYDHFCMPSKLPLLINFCQGIIQGCFLKSIGNPDAPITTPAYRTGGVDLARFGKAPLFARFTGTQAFSRAFLSAARRSPCPISTHCGNLCQSLAASPEAAITEFFYTETRQHREVRPASSSFHALCDLAKIRTITSHVLPATCAAPAPAPPADECSR